MLSNKDVMATIPVKDLARADKFYGELLGFEKVGDDTMKARGYRSGSATMLVYESEYAGTNQATAATWIVGGDIESIVEALQKKGVAFEHYDLPGGQRQGAIHIFGKIRNAWFKDPDGNILSIVNG